MTTAYKSGCKTGKKAVKSLKSLNSGVSRAFGRLTATIVSVPSNVLHAGASVGEFVNGVYHSINVETGRRKQLTHTKTEEFDVKEALQQVLNFMESRNFAQTQALRFESNTTAHTYWTRCVIADNKVIDSLLTKIARSF